VINSEKGFFDSKDLMLRLLAGIGDPFRGRKFAGALADEAQRDEALEEFLKDPVFQRLRVDMTEKSIRCAFERVGKARRLRYLLLDEAQLMCKCHLTRDPIDHLESIKMLATEMGLVVILFGTYAMLEIWNQTAQLNRRSATFHIRRYRLEEPADVAEFRNILSRYESEMPVTPGLLSSLASYIYSATLGIFGEVDRLLFRSEQLAKARGDSLVTEAHIKSSIHTAAQLRTLYREVANGEELLRPADTFPDMAVIRAEEAKILNEGKRSYRSKRKVGRRNPIRDTVCAH
jgi:hypothetical protein